MREIKFRAWDKKYGMMDSDFYIHSSGSQYDLAARNYNTPHIEIEHTELELMQYTGLKDKNGVEIYEGDIVCDRYANNYTPIFRNGTYMAYNVDCLYLTKQEPSTQFNVVWKDGCEIIGNIYENPELLETKKSS